MTESILVWPRGRQAPQPLPVDGYSIQPLPADQDSWWLNIQCQAVPHYTSDLLTPSLERYRRLALAEGILIAVEECSRLPVATAGSLISPRDDLFLNAGEIGWVATVPEHRQKGLSQWLCGVALNRLLAQDFDTIFLSTGRDMPDAIRLYFRLGFVPYLYAPEQWGEWEEICQENRLPFEPDRWISK